LWKEDEMQPEEVMLIKEEEDVKFVEVDNILF
jgi:hypothetical protein